MSRGQNRLSRKHHPKGKCVCGCPSSDHAMRGYCKALIEKPALTKEGKKTTVAHKCGCQKFRPAEVAAKRAEEARRTRLKKSQKRIARRERFAAARKKRADAREAKKVEAAAA